VLNTVGFEGPFLKFGDEVVKLSKRTISSSSAIIFLGGKPIKRAITNKIDVSFFN